MSTTRVGCLSLCCLATYLITRRNNCIQLDAVFNFPCLPHPPPFLSRSLSIALCSNAPSTGTDRFSCTKNAFFRRYFFLLIGTADRYIVRFCSMPIRRAHCHEQLLNNYSWACDTHRTSLHFDGLPWVKQKSRLMGTPFAWSSHTLAQLRRSKPRIEKWSWQPLRGKWLAMHGTQTASFASYLLSIRMWFWHRRENNIHSHSMFSF